MFLPAKLSPTGTSSKRTIAIATASKRLPSHCASRFSNAPDGANRKGTTMSMLLWDDTPLPAEIKKTGTIIRIKRMWHEGFSAYDTTRFFGVVRIDGKDCMFR